METPRLDPRPSGRPMDWSYNKIQEIKAKVKEEEIKIPDSWENPYAKLTAPRDQGFRGTCVGQSCAYCYDIRYIELTGEKPTPEDIAQYKKNVVDSLGTTHDVLYPQSASAEAFYQISRTIGNVTYPSGSETRYAARAWIQYGMVPETGWHTDSTGKCVWDKQPRKTVDGGLSPEEAKIFAEKHRAEGWAMCGDSNGNATYSEICRAIYEKGFVLAGIPVYENYETMQGGDGAFPEPRGNIAGYHALILYGYTPDKIKLIHSWGNFCGRFGSISKEYFNSNIYESVYLVILDSQDVKIGRETYASLLVTVKDNVTKQPIPATISVEGIQIGISPQKFAVETGKTYIIQVVMEGYKPSKTYLSYGGQTEEVVYLDPLSEPEEKSWWQRLVDWFFRLFGR